MIRRTLVKTLALGLGAQLLCAHTPYGQWVIYRKKHLLIGCHRADPETYTAAKAIVSILEEHLPAANARVARAPDARRLASLLSTDQMEVAVLSPSDASDMANGLGAFKPYGKIPLDLISTFGPYVVVADNNFPAKHAWLLSSVLLYSDPLPTAKRAMSSSIRWHRGSQAFINGDPAPE